MFAVTTTKKTSNQKKYVALELIAVPELSKFRPLVGKVDEVFERNFLTSLNHDTNKKSGVTETPTMTTNLARHASISEAPFFASEMKKYSTSTSTNVTSISDQPSAEVYGNLQPILESKKFRFSKDRRLFLRKHCGGISWDSINEIAQKTVNQFDDPSYLILRKYRLTASSFGSILNAIQHDSYPPSLFKKLLSSCNSDEISDDEKLTWRVKARRWGRFHESIALETLRRLHPLWDIKRAGLYLHESGLLGASPDAVTDECVIEIKCPYRFRRKESLEKSMLPETKYIITRAANGTYLVNPNHVYYDQVQAEILFSGRQYGLLFIWTPNEAKSFRIEKDESWAQNIDLILQFYTTKFVPYLLDLQTNNETEVNKIKMLTS